MAEAFGVFVGVANLAQLLVQVVNGIDTLREISKRAENAPSEIISLSKELICLQMLMKDVLDKVPCRNDTFIQHCSSTCENVVKALQKLKNRFPIDSKVTGKPNVKKILVFRHWKQDVEDLQRSIESAKSSLILANTRHHSTQLEKLSLQIEELKLMGANTTQNPSPKMSSVGSKIFITDSSPHTSPLYSYDNSKVDSQALTSPLPSRYKNLWDCTKRHCSCSCHRTTRKPQRFLSVEYTPLVVFRQTCDKRVCTATNYGGTFRLAFSRLGVQWSAIAQIQTFVASGKLLLRSNFAVERTVPYTSPGFETLWRFQHSLITGEEARDKLVNLYHSDPTFKDHVNPSGRSYIEELVRVRFYCAAGISEKFKLLDLFMGEFGMTKGTQSTKFLNSCTNWFGDGSRLELLKALLHLGFDPTLVDSPQAGDWSNTYLHDGRPKSLAPDPFFIQYQAMLLRNNQGFGNLTPLHEAILFGSVESFNKWVSCSEINQKNFRGQTPVHFAASASNPKYLLALIEAGHDLDEADNYGATPLMYAAAGNQKECLKTLLEAGANYNIQDRPYLRRTFMDYAALSGHWSLVLESLIWIAADAEREVAEGWAQSTLLRYCVDHAEYLEERDMIFAKLLAMCGTVNFKLKHYGPSCEAQDETLLYYVTGVKDIETLLERGFTLVNHVNSNGQHALMSIASTRCKPDVVRKLLDAGTAIDLKDNSQYTTLYYVLDRLEDTRYDSVHWEIIDTLCTLLAHGADALCTDSCVCPCSPNGCLPSSVLKNSVYGTWSTGSVVSVWSLEYLSMVLEYRSQSEAQTILLSFIRRGKFDELGLTHVCCNRTGRSPRVRLYQNQMLDEDDIDEILDEEAEFIEILEKEMEICYTKDYDSLLDDWLLQIKSSLQQACENAAIHSSQPAYVPKHRVRYELDEMERTVDYKNDCFRTHYRTYENPATESMCEVAHYICWIEQEYSYRSTSGHEESLRDAWYFGRISWLRRLIDVLGISTADISDRLRALRLSTEETKYKSIDIEDIIKHFILSLEQPNN